jgi:hypothetical protein
MGNEIWKDIVGFEGLYQVSNYGRVKSLKNKSKPFKKFSVGKVGYPYVALWQNNKQLVFYIHRLVATYFIPNKENKKYVNHINLDKLDFRIENLEWVTNMENSYHYENSRENKSSKYIGVYYHFGKWESCCWFKNKKQYIGRFVTEDEAKDAQIKFMAENKIVNKYAVK